MRHNFFWATLVVVTLLLGTTSASTGRRAGGDAQLQTEFNATESGFRLTLSLPGNEVGSIDLSPSPLGWHSRASFGSHGEILRLHQPSGVQLLSDRPARCETLHELPLVQSAQERLEKLDLAQVEGDQEALWVEYLLGQWLIAALNSCADANITPHSGYCSIQPTYSGCHTCCTIEERINSILVRGCTGASGASASTVGGPIGAVVGGTIGYALCDLLLSESSCHSRCEGKDGDSTPIECVIPGDDHEFGVCREICEDPSHDQGPSGCPSVLGLTCCAYEYDAPDETLCPPSICPGTACPPSCGGSFN